MRASRPVADIHGKAQSKRKGAMGGLAIASDVPSADSPTAWRAGVRSWRLSNAHPPGTRGRSRTSGRLGAGVLRRRRATGRRRDVHGEGGTMKAGPRLLHSHRTAGRIVRARLLDGLGSRRELPASKGLMPPRIPGGKVCPYEFLEPKVSLPLPPATPAEGQPG